jgi:hypothetical protein
MSLDQSDFREQFSYQAPILPESLDNATAFFYALNQLIRSTPSEISGTLAPNKPVFASWLLDRLCIRIGGAAPSIWKR